MKPKFLLRAFVVGAIAVFSVQGNTRDLDCIECNVPNVENQCVLVYPQIQAVDTQLQAFKLNNSETAPLSRSSTLLKTVNEKCQFYAVQCPKTCGTIFPTELRNKMKKENDDANDRIKKASYQIANKNDGAADTKSTALKADGTDNARDYSSLYDESGASDTGGGDGGGYTGGEGTSGGASAGTEKSKANDSKSSMNAMMPLMQMAMQMIAAKQQQQAQQQLSCSGPNPAPGCPPQHACFTNPSSLECKCGPYGPGGPECGRPQLAATERNLGSPIEKDLQPPPPSEMGSPELNGIPEFQRSTTSSTAVGAGGGGGSLGNTASSPTPPKKKGGGGGGGGSLKDLTGARGFMGASPSRTGGGGGGAGKEGGGDGRSKRDDPRLDPQLQGAQLHYGRMLQAGMEHARRRTAGTRQIVTSKEVRPASDNIFKAVNEAYQAKDGTFLR